MPDANKEPTRKGNDAVNEHTLCNRYAYALTKHGIRAFYPVLVISAVGLAICVNALIFDVLAFFMRIFYIIILVAYPFVFAYIHYTQKHTRLFLMPGGMAYRSPLPKPLQRLHPSWSLQYSEVISVHLEPLRYTGNPLRATLKFETSGRSRRLRPLWWVDLQGDEPISKHELTRELRRGRDLYDLVRHTPVIEHLSATGLKVITDQQ